MALTSLETDDFLKVDDLFLDAKSLYLSLSQNPSVLEVRREILDGEVCDEDVAEFVAMRIASLSHGRLFRYDTTLAALAVALELVPEDWAHEFVSGLAEMSIPELPNASRVAMICLGKSC